MIRNTINEDPRKIKRREFLRKYGISISLGACAILATGIAIITGGQNAKEPQQFATNPPLLQATSTPDFQYLENIPLPKVTQKIIIDDPDDEPDDSEEVTPISQNDPSIKKTNEIISNLIKPVNGEVQRQYAKDVLVYSTTLREYCTHLALDIEGAVGQSVKCAQDGTVSACGSDKLLGNYVIIDHNDNFTTGYYSLDSFNVSTGDKVERGDIIGVVGSSSLLESAQGDHVHFEAILNGINIDPCPYFVE